MSFYRATRRVLRIARDQARQLQRQAAWSIHKRRVIRAIEPVPTSPAAVSLRGATFFFVPYAGVTPMFAQACVVGRTLKERGHRVLFARCYRIFERCPAMDNDRLSYEASADEKRESCLHCADNSLSMLAAYGLEAVDLRPFVTPVMAARVEGAVAETPPDLLQFQFAELPFGMLTAMDLVLARKVSDFRNVSQSDRSVWMQYLRSALWSHLLVDRLCREFGVARIVHTNDYSLLLGARTAAQKNDIPCYGLAFPGHRNADLRRYLMLPNVWRPFSFKLLASWPACRDLCLDPIRVREVGEDLLVRLSGVGSHIYSPAKTTDAVDIRARLGLASDRRLVVAYTSSLDELIASRMGTDALGIKFPDRPQPFRDQIEWLRALTEYIEESDDLQLVVRIHPREGVNKRESVASQHLQRLQEAFGGTYRHCRFVWPSDPLSSYDLGEAAELALISWSTIGLELARLGVPVLASFNGGDVAIAHDDFLEWSPTPSEYFAKLRALLERPATTEHVARAFRWYSLYTLGTTVDLSDVVPRNDFYGLPEYKTPAEADTIEQILIGGKEVCDLNIERLRESQDAGSRERESAEILRQLRRLVHFLMTGQNSPEDPPLIVRSRTNEWIEESSDKFAERSVRSPAGPQRVLEYEGFYAQYHDGARVYRRYSPMAVRLARLSNQEIAEPAAIGGRQ